MAPKIVAPSASSISSRTRSPKRMNGVTGAPCSMVSIMRTSAMHDQPLLRSELLTVPEPTMAPAPSTRVRAAWAISSPKSNCISTPASARPTCFPLNVTSKGLCSLASSQADPSSSGVTATGEKAVAGLPWKKPKPLASSLGMRPRSDTSLTSITSLICARAASAVTPMATSSVITATSPSMSMPKASSAARMASRGPMKASEPPWYISGSCRKLGGISAPRALRTSSTWLR